ncbi:hypothetical protein HOK021_39320 [Streptomyces hygroscopicus]|nr:hypothetical protein HOK021_39320 [Streptomyces hygroscopicus]
MPEAGAPILVAIISRAMRGSSPVRRWARGWPVRRPVASATAWASGGADGTALRRDDFLVRVNEFR